MSKAAQCQRSPHDLHHHSFVIRVLCLKAPRSETVPITLPGCDVPWARGRSVRVRRCYRLDRITFMPDVTRLLDAAAAGDPTAAADLLPLVYDELRKLAAARLAGEPPGQTLQPTALVHEAYLRLVGATPQAGFDGRGHFFAAAAE